MRLPLRVLPSRKMQAVAIVFALAGLGVVGFFAWMEWHGGPWQSDQTPGVVVFVWLMILAMALMALGALAVAILRMLPDSPHYHLLLTAQSITVRTLLKSSQFPWSSLDPFTIVKLSDSDSSVTWIVAAAAGDARPARNDKERHRQAAFRLKSGTYGGDKQAKVLADWLNAVRLAMTAGSPSRTEVEVPAALQGQVLAVAPVSGVIER